MLNDMLNGTRSGARASLCDGVRRRRADKDAAASASVRATEMQRCSGGVRKRRVDKDAAVLRRPCRLRKAATPGALSGPSPAPRSGAFPASGFLYGNLAYLLYF